MAVPAARAQSAAVNCKGGREGEEAAQPASSACGVHTDALTQSSRDTRGGAAESCRRWARPCAAPATSIRVSSCGACKSPRDLRVTISGKRREGARSARWLRGRPGRLGAPAASRAPVGPGPWGASGARAPWPRAAPRGKMSQAKKREALFCSNGVVGGSLLFVGLSQCC